MNHAPSLNILIALYYYDPYVSGVTIYAKRLAEELVKKGHAVTVVTSRHSRTLPRRECINGVTVKRCGVLLKVGKGVVMPTFWLQVAWLSRKFDVINPHLPIADTGLSAIFIPRNKLVATYQCDLSLSPKLGEKLIEKISYVLMSIQLSRASSIIVLSADYFANSKMKRFAFKAVPIYPPIPENIFRKTSALDLKKELGIKPNEIVIGFMGRLVYEKGIAFLLQAIPEIKKKIKNFKVVIAGDYKNVAGGSIKEELEKYTTLYKENIVFTGFLDDAIMSKFYSMLDVLVLPSIDPLEAFGMVQVEAMLCGTPVVASNMPGVREVINKTNYGLLSNPRNPKDIAKKIINVIDNKKLYKPRRERVVKIFSQSETIQSYSRLFENLPN